MQWYFDTIIEINNWNIQYQLIEIAIGMNNFSHNWNLIVIEMHIHNWINNWSRNYFYNYTDKKAVYCFTSYTILLKTTTWVLDWVPFQVLNSSTQLEYLQHLYSPQTS